jgi:hypothetical protein
VKDDAAGLPVVFALGGDKATYYKWEMSPGSWSNWYSLGGYVQSITVGRDASGRLEVCALGTNNVLYVNRQSFPNSIAFNGWQNLGGHALQQLTLANDASGRLTVFALGSDHAVYNKQQDSSGTWGGWGTLYGYVQSIAAGRDALGRMEVVAVGFDDQVYAIRQTAANGPWGNWSAWGLGGTWPGTVTLGNEANGALDVFAEVNDIDASNWAYTRV